MAPAAEDVVMKKEVEDEEYILVTTVDDNMELIWNLDKNTQNIDENTQTIDENLNSLSQSISSEEKSSCQGELPQTPAEKNGGNVPSELPRVVSVFPSNVRVMNINKKRKRFLVAEFLTENCSAVVPENWENSGFCFWPPLTPSQKIKSLVKSFAKPKSNWLKLKTRILHSCGSYSKARKKLKWAKEISDLKSLILDGQINTEGNPKRRKISDGPLIVSEENGESAPSVSNCTEPLTTPAPSISGMGSIPTAPAPSVSGMFSTPTAPAPSISGMGSTPTAPAQSISGMGSTPITPVPSISGMCSTPAPSISGMFSTPTAPAPSISTMGSTPTAPAPSISGMGSSPSQNGVHVSASDEVFQRKVLKMLEEIKQEQKEQRALLNRLVKTSDPNSLPEDCPKTPVRTVEELLAFDKYLGNKDNFIQTCSFYGSIGGFDTKDTVRRMLRCIMTNALSMKFNWKGRSNWKGKEAKIAFSQFANVIKLILDSVKQNNQATNHEIEMCIKRWLVYAQDRDGGRARRAVKYIAVD